MKTTYPKLPKKFKEKWLKALRSGEYDQTTGQLCKDEAYCCIGIAGKVQGISDNVLKGKGLFNDSFSFPRFDRIQRLIPNILIGKVNDNVILTRLVNMNDGIGMKKQSFKQIANWIETNL